MKKGWETKQLGEVIKLLSGQHIEAKDYNTEARGIGYLTGPSDFGPINPIVTKWTEFPKVTAKSGDILITVKGSGVGKINLLDGADVAISRQLMAIRVTGADPRFVYSFLGSTFDHFQAESTGAAIPGISREQVLGLQIGLPPLAEQQRIVGLLDEAFEGIATAKANAEKNLQNARALFESHLQSVFSQRGKGWVEHTLGDVFSTATGTTPPKTDAKFYGDFMPLAKPPELCDEPFDSASDGLSKAGAAVARTLPAKSVLVSCIGNLGKIGLNIVPVAFNQQINAILPDDKRAVPEFMFFQSLSPAFKEQLESLASGTTVPIVNKSKFNSVRIVLPPLTIQKPVVSQLTELREETQRLATLYTRKLAALEALKKSLLHQAFSGEL